MSRGHPTSVWGERVEGKERKEEEEEEEEKEEEEEGEGVERGGGGGGGRRRKGEEVEKNGAKESKENQRKDDKCFNKIKNGGDQVHSIAHNYMCNSLITHTWRVISEDLCSDT